MIKKSSIITIIPVILIIFQLLPNTVSMANGKDSFLCGDFSNDGTINLLDITFFLGYLYMGGPEPAVPDAGDVNNSGSLNILDITYLITYIYMGGPEPTCPDPPPDPDPLPETYDLRNVEGVNYVSSVKSQLGDNCWAFATMSSAESNLMMTGAWTAAGEEGEPNLAEYHLDWWNGFNNYWNPEVDTSTDVPVSGGGTFQMSAAYFSRGDGAVRDIDGQSHTEPPDHFNDSFHRFYVRDIEWYSSMIWENMGEAKIDLIKRKVMEHGAVAVMMCNDLQFLHTGCIYYYPDSANCVGDFHTVAIVGWDDNLVTGAPERGAWLCKNSYGANYCNDGYIWGSYYDKLMGKYPDQGAIAFINVEPLQYDRFHVHDIHGWTRRLHNTPEAFNAFTAEKNEVLLAVNFVTLHDTVDYTVKVYDTYDGINLSDELVSFSGTIEFKGIHTVDLPAPLQLEAGNDFYIYLNLSDGYMAYDADAYVENIPGAKSGRWIRSKSKPNQSYYRNGKSWNDLYMLDTTANFCIKGLGYDRSIKVLPWDDMEFDGPKEGPIMPSGITYKLTHKYDNPINFQASVVSGAAWVSLSGDISGSLMPGDTAEITVAIDETETPGMPQGLHETAILFENLEDPDDDITRNLLLILGTPQVQYEWLLNSDPGWICEAEWEFGAPTGGGGNFGYGHDPVGGFTDANVYGYNIDGNYPDTDLAANLTSAPIDCSNLVKVSLNFQRWLAADGFGYGHVKVSSNGTDWITVWTGDDDVNNNTWIESDYDISELANFQPTLYLRWTMVVENEPLYTFGGWNIDDIRIIGIYDSASTVLELINNEISSEKSE